MLRKLFRPTVAISWTILEKETVDEIIFRTTKVRSRLMLELMARGGMRIGEVLKLRFIDIQGRKLILKELKSGKVQEVVFIPQKVADRLQEYARQKCRKRTIVSSQFRMRLQDNGAKSRKYSRYPFAAA